MIGLLFYSIGCVVIAAVITMVAVMFRPIQDRGETKPWKTLLVSLVLVTVAPYALGEVLTRWVGKEMSAAVQEGFDSADIQGDMKYYKVIWYTGEKAKAIAVGEETEAWGGKDRPLVTVNLVKKGKTWECDTFKLVYSMRKNRDGITFPPYW